MSLLGLAAGRELGALSPHSLRCQISANQAVIERLELQRKLEGHSGELGGGERAA